MDNKGKVLVLEISFDFARDIIIYCKKLEKERFFVVADQLFRASTSIGASIREAQNAESRKDFIHKMKIAIKEAEEAEYWLLLCKHSEDYPDCNQLLIKNRSIIKVLAKIISTSIKNSRH